MKRTMIRCTVLMLVVLGAGRAVLGHDIAPPPWWDGGSDAMRYAGWEFDFCTKPGQVIPPDFGNNPQASLTWTPGSFPLPFWIPHYHRTGSKIVVPPGERYASGSGMGFGLVPLSGEINIDLPNATETRPEKKVWVQLTWAREPFTQGVPLVELTNAIIPGGDDYTSSSVAEVSSTSYGRFWTHSVYEFSIFPNPEFETIRISGKIFVDEVVVDTWCIPEPATVSLLGVGALALLRRRK